MENNARIELQLPKELKQQIRDVAKEEERSVNALIRLAIKKYLEARS